MVGTRKLGSVTASFQQILAVAEAIFSVAEISRSSKTRMRSCTSYREGNRSSPTRWPYPRAPCAWGGLCQFRSPPCLSADPLLGRAPARRGSVIVGYEALCQDAGGLNLGCCFASLPRILRIKRMTTTDAPIARQVSMYTE